MYSSNLALVLAIWVLNFVSLANAGIFVLKPTAGSKCHANRECVISWLDDGVQPLLSAAGVCTLGLYTGKQKLVQVIPPVDVSATRSVSFKPNPAAGPNSDAYYISIISTTAKTNSSLPYAAFSPFFSIDQMTGSFDNPPPEATSTISIPASLTRLPPGSGTDTSTKLSTITVGTLSTSLSPRPRPTSTSKSPNSSSSSTSPTSMSQTKLSTSILSSTPTGASTPASTPSSNNAIQHTSQILDSRTTISLLLLFSLIRLF